MASQDPRTKALVKIIDAAGKRQEADRKFKREMLKMRLQSEMRVKERGQKDQNRQAMKSNNPEQAFLMRKVRERNPLMDMNIPEEGSEDTSVSFPASKVDRGSNGLVEKPLNERDQASMFVTKYNKMSQEGRKPHPAMKAVYDKYFQKLNHPKADVQKEYRASRATQDVLDEIADGIDKKKIRSKEDVQNYVQKHEQAFRVKGADMNHVVRKAYESLPDKYVDKKNFLGSEFGSKPDVKKIGDTWYKKSKDGWGLADPDDYEDLV